VATITIDRPEVMNAFNAAAIAGLRSALSDLAADSSVRMAILTGAGKAFCAGGDMNWMRETFAWSKEENMADAEAMAAMFDEAWRFPKPLIARVNGPAVGGGAGLVACCDLAIATETARFGFGEVKIGIIPAVIAQYVVPKIGVSHARALFVSGEQFSAERAFEIGLIHAVTAQEELDETVASILARLLTSAPEAVAATKRSIDIIWESERSAARQFVIEAIATIRTGSEAQEGMRAFLEKRRPRWSIFE
jgi:methylglutaconyl-CoA hydratase